MRPHRVSILGLLVWVALLGVGLAALKSPSPLWSAFLFSVVLATLTLSVLAAVYRRARRRAFWVGFATCGWVYFLLTDGPVLTSQFEPYLFTTGFLQILHPLTLPPAPGPAAQRRSPPAPTVVFARGGPRSGRAITVGGFGVPVPPPSAWASWTEADRSVHISYGPEGGLRGAPHPFMRIGHSLFCLLAALVGGLITRHLHATRDEPAPTVA